MFPLSPIGLHAKHQKGFICIGTPFTVRSCHWFSLYQLYPTAAFIVVSRKSIHASMVASLLIPAMPCNQNSPLVSSSILSVDCWIDLLEQVDAIYNLTPRSCLTLDYVLNCFGHIVSVHFHSWLLCAPRVWTLSPSLHFLFSYVECCCHCLTNWLRVVSEIMVTMQRGKFLLWKYVVLHAFACFAWRQCLPLQVFYHVELLDHQCCLLFFLLLVHIDQLPHY